MASILALDQVTIDRKKQISFFETYKVILSTIAFLVLEIGIFCISISAKMPCRVVIVYEVYIKYIPRENIHCKNEWSVSLFSIYFPGCSCPTSLRFSS